jgi:hypothetical protein
VTLVLDGTWYGMTSLCEEFGYDFCGIKGQRELTEHYVTSDIAEAFLNDYYGPDGTPHDPVICATEADMDDREEYPDPLQVEATPADVIP